MQRTDDPGGPEPFLSRSSFWAPEWIPTQTAWHTHAPFAFWIMEAHRPRCLVELGTQWGFSYMSFCQSAQRNRLDVKCHAVDTWKGDKHASFYGEDVFAAVCEHNESHYAKFSTLIRSTFDQALDLFPEGSVDLLHIDGMHTYEAVKHDFESWLPKMSDRGLVLFHDTRETVGDFGVFRLWQELAGRYPHFEFSHGHGLGVLGVGSRLLEAIVHLLSLGKNPAVAESVRAAYERLGMGVIQDARVAGEVLRLEQCLGESSVAFRQQEEKIAGLEQGFAEKEQHLEDKLRQLEQKASRQQQALSDLQDANSDLQSANSELQQALASVEAWQRSWFRRAFTRWRMVETERRPGFFRRLERSVRKRRRRLMSAFGYREVENSTHPAGKDDYQQWIQRYDTADATSRGRMRERIAKLENPPLISVVMPTFNSKSEWLEQAVASVERQLYPHWELCIADDASSEPHVRRMLEEFQRRDPRIRVVYRETTGHISLASNSALELARGNYVAFLDHDDTLAEHALFFVAMAVSENPEARVIYSDEDKLAADGRRVEPHFKSDWNPDLFYSQNYVCHLAVYRRDLLAKAGGLRPGVEGSQDHDLLLRCLPNIPAGGIVHIPRILYHWRIDEGSTALEAGGKSYTTHAGIKALRDHFEEVGPPGITVAKGAAPNTYRVRWPLPVPPPLASLLIPTRDRLPLIETAVRGILEKTSYANFEILILDNGSVEPGTLEFFAEIQTQDDRVRVLHYDRPFNFSGINNFGATHARGSILGFINNDIEVIHGDWLGEMVAQAGRPEIGCVGAKLYYGDGRIQHAGVILGIGGVAGHSHKYYSRRDAGYFSRLMLAQSVSAVTGACLLVRREVFERAGGFDEENLPVAFNDVDLCLKVRELGFRNLWTPHAELYHLESISRGAEDTPEKQGRFEKEVLFILSKWGSLLERDPFYNPNLTLEHEDFGLSQLPPRLAEPSPAAR